MRREEMSLSKWSIGSRRSLVIAAAVLSLFGVVMIYSASNYQAELQTGDAWFYAKKQAISLIPAFLACVLGSKISLKFLCKIRYVILGFSILSLALVFIPGLGVESYGATRWLNLGVTTVQPSEFAKFGLMLFLAGEMSVHPPVKFRYMIAPLLSIGATCALIMLEPNMSITMCVGLASIIVLFVGGIKPRYFVALLVLVGVAVPLMIILEPYRMNRLVAFVDPWANPRGEGYQLIQSYYALGSGGLFGVGLLKSRQKFLFLPFSESDFIFSIIGEELGAIGATLMLLVFFIIVYAGVKIAKRAGGRFESLLAVGITAIIAVQTILNVAVVTGSIPPTGLPLPFVSAGGSSLMAFMFAVGLLVNVDKKAPLQPLRHSML